MARGIGRTSNTLLTGGARHGRPESSMGELRPRAPRYFLYWGTMHFRRASKSVLLVQTFTYGRRP